MGNEKISYSRLGQWSINDDERQGDKNVSPSTPTKPIKPVDPVSTPAIKGMKGTVNPHDVGQRQGSKKVKPHNPLDNPAHHKDPRPHVAPLMHSESTEKTEFSRLGQYGISSTKQGDKPTTPYKPTKPITPTTPVPAKNVNERRSTTSSPTEPKALNVKDRRGTAGDKRIRAK